jgi:hypothetical protein
MDPHLGAPACSDALSRDEPSPFTLLPLGEGDCGCPQAFTDFVTSASVWCCARSPALSDFTSSRHRCQ